MQQKTRYSIQAEHRDSVRQNRKRFEEAVKEFKNETAELSLLKQKRSLEKWKIENQAILDEFLDDLRETHRHDVEVRLQSAKMNYAKQAYALGIDLELVKQIFHLDEDEEGEVYRD